MNKLNSIKLTLETHIGDNLESKKKDISLEFDHSEMTPERASYEVLSAGIALVTECIRKQGRNPTKAEVLSIMAQAFDEY